MRLWSSYSAAKSNEWVLFDLRGADTASLVVKVGLLVTAASERLCRLVAGSDEGRLGLMTRHALVAVSALVCGLMLATPGLAAAQDRD
jgi:hypothetical protein